MRLFWVLALVACSSSAKPPPQPVVNPPTPAIAAGFKPLGAPRVVRFAVTTWVGWAPIVLANDGHKPRRVWKDSQGGEFLLELVLIDSPSTLATTFASGDLHLAGASVDILPRLAERLDARAMPRVFQLVDWSNGGDGIVVRGAIKQVSDLRGKTIVLSESSPSHYFLLDTLRDAGVQPNEVKLRFTQDAFQAAAAFNQAPDIDAVVARSPDLHNLTRAPNRLLIGTALATRAVADAWFARADFAQAHPAIVEALVRGALDAVTTLTTTKQTAAKLMDAFLSLPDGTAARLLDDVRFANHADNRAFLLDRDDPSNFARTYDNAATLYQSIKLIEKRIPPDQLVDPSIIGKLQYATHELAPPIRFAPVPVDLQHAVLTKTVTINFYPNSYDLWKQTAETAYYDPNIERTIADIARLAIKFGGARIHIGGFTDGSMKGVADETLVRTLSEQRANAVRDALVHKYKVETSRLLAEGFGWDRPADPQDPDNHAKNRRVEIRVLAPDP